MLTLAIPYHSHPELLRVTLDSVVKQSSPTWEAVVCDDSADESARAVVAQVNHPRIRWVKSPTKGIVGNWNFAIAQVQSDLFSLLHADDELEPEYVAEMSALAESKPDAAAYYCRANIIGSDGGPTFSFADWIKKYIEGSRTEWAGESAAVQLLRGDFIFAPTLVYRRAHVEHGFDARFSQVMDLHMLFTLLEKNRIVGSARRLYRYRRHEQNLTAQQTRDLSRFHEEKALYDEWADRFHKWNWLEAEKTARRQSIIKLHLLYRALQDAVGLRWKSAFAKLGLLRSRT